MDVKFAIFLLLVGALSVTAKPRLYYDRFDYDPPAEQSKLFFSSIPCIKEMSSV